MRKREKSATRHIVYKEKYVDIQQKNHCKALILQLQSEKDIEKQRELRNSIFLLIKPFMEKWIASILSKKQVFLNRHEMKSVSWDCFEYCLRLYQPSKDIPVPNHFYAYSKFFLSGSRKSLKKDPSVSGQDYESFSEAASSDMHPFDAYESIDELKSFRSRLPSAYVPIFDDAIMSLAPGNNQKMNRSSEIPVPYDKYMEAKRIFKIVIEFLLLR